MERRRLTDFDAQYPEAMLIYMRHNGPHFNRNLYEFAVSKMTKIDASGEEVPIKPFTKEEVEKILKEGTMATKKKAEEVMRRVRKNMKLDYFE